MIDTLKGRICKYNLGGVIFFKSGPVGLANLANDFQALAKTPMFIAIDGEWGLGMRMKDSAISYPKQMTLGAVQDNTLIYKMGKEIANEFRRIGININFAPVVDINNNPRNPVIGTRSFGEDKYYVAEKGIAYMKGMQENGLVTSAKHFPGHGDTDKDSHKTLPVINHKISEIYNTDLYPFIDLIANDVSSVMVAHLYIPALDTSKNLAASLSYNVITGVLRNKLCYEGLVFTDALDMKGISSYNKKGEASLKAFIAGNDILLLPENVDSAVCAIKEALYNNIIIEQEIDARCRKILHNKYKIGVNKVNQVNIKNINSDINSPKGLLLNKELYNSSSTLAFNYNNLLPLKNYDTLKIASLCVGQTEKTKFQETLDNYARIDHYFLPKKCSFNDADSMKKILKQYDLVIIGLMNNTNTVSDSFGVHKCELRIVDSIKANANVILTVFTNPYTLSYFKSLKNIGAIIEAYQNTEEAQISASQLIFGSIEAKGKLPVTASNNFPINTGLNTEKFKLKYTTPEYLGLNQVYFDSIDAIANKGIKDEVYPGCQIMVIKDNNVIYQKSFGNYSYSNEHPVTNSDIYDLASITKVAATTLSIMKLYEMGLIHLDWKLGDFLPKLKNSNKGNITIKDVMMHQARLKAWIPFYLETIIDRKLDTNIYKKIYSQEYSYKVADSIFISKNYSDSIFIKITKSDLKKDNAYLYSDLGFYLLKEIVERVSGKTLDKYADENFYKSMELPTMCFRPLQYFPKERMAPTENDTIFRHQIIQGYVHDPGAAMMGGVSGHAGLFSDANDLGILFNMLIDGGKYAGKQYFQDSTIKKFTNYQTNSSRRGLGFDKQTQNHINSPCCKEASNESFGHSGFTGTFVWADPKYKLVYVFLSNRTYPNSAVNKLVGSGIRTKIQSQIYKAIFEKEKK